MTNILTFIRFMHYNNILEMFFFIFEMKTKHENENIYIS